MIGKRACGRRKERKGICATSALVTAALPLLLRLREDKICKSGVTCVYSATVIHHPSPSSHLCCRLRSHRIGGKAQRGGRGARKSSGGGPFASSRGGGRWGNAN